MTANTSPTIVLLAAGPGRRFVGAGHKLAQPLGASTVLGRTLNTALSTGWRVVVVCSEALAPAARATVATRDIVVLPPSRIGGMGDSIAAGVSATAGASGWVLLPGDQPLVEPRTLVQVAQALKRCPLVYAQYKGRPGFPVACSAEMVSELLALHGDDAVRRLLNRFAAEAVEVDDEGVLLGVDTADDLERAQAQLQATEARRRAM